MINIRELIRKFESDPESVDYRQIFKVATRERPNDLFVAPYLTLGIADFYGEQYCHSLRLAISKAPRMLSRHRTLDKEYLEIGEVTGNLRQTYNNIDDKEYESSLRRYNNPPYYFRQLTLTDTYKTEHEDPLYFSENKIKSILNDVFGAGFDYFSIYGNIDLPNSFDENTGYIVYRQEYKVTGSKEEFLSAIENSMIDFAKKIIDDFNYFENNPSFPYQIDNVVFLPYLFGRENYKPVLS